MALYRPLGAHVPPTTHLDREGAIARRGRFNVGQKYGIDAGLWRWCSIVKDQSESVYINCMQHIATKSNRRSIGDLQASSFACNPGHGNVDAFRRRLWSFKKLEVVCICLKLCVWHSACVYCLEARSYQRSWGFRLLGGQKTVAVRASKGCGGTLFMLCGHQVQKTISRCSMHLLLI